MVGFISFKLIKDFHHLYQHSLAFIEVLWLFNFGLWLIIYLVFEGEIFHQVMVLQSFWNYLRALIF